MLTPDVVITGQCQPQGPAPQTPGARAGTSCPAQVTAASPGRANYTLEFYASFIVSCKTFLRDTEVCFPEASFFWGLSNKSRCSMHPDDW